MANKGQNWFYYTGRWLMVFCLRLLTNWEVHGRENVPREGSLLVISNHMNYADPPLVAVSVPRKLYFMAKEELFKSRLTGYFVRNFGAFPVRRGTIDRNAIRQAHEILEDGSCLAMFPEGMRSREGTMIPAFPGSAMIAFHNKVSILPVGIIGTEKMVGWWMFKRPRIIVKIGKPFLLNTVNSRVTKGELVNLSDEMMCHIADLLPETYHGCYADKVKK